MENKYLKEILEIVQKQKKEILEEIGKELLEDAYPEDFRDKRFYMARVAYNARVKQEKEILRLISKDKWKDKFVDL